MKILLYHASNLEIKYPDNQHSREFLDFGKGFYLTHIREQAISYAQRFKRRSQPAWLNIYELDFKQDDWNVLIFDEYNREWLDFISNCRSGNDRSDYDMIIGGIANDKVIRTLDRYFEDELTTEQALGYLIYEVPNIQYCIRSQNLLDNCVKFIESIRL